MSPFGGTSVCPRCQKPVYAAEQVMGPGRKFYHKPCLVCTTCNKRLDSLQLLEHDQEPYCRSCHVMNFGTRDLRHANLSNRAGSQSLPSSPTKGHTSSSALVPQSTTESERAPHSPSSPRRPEQSLITVPATDVFSEEYNAAIALDRPAPNIDSASAGLVHHNHGNGFTSWSSRNNVESGEELDGTRHSHSNSLDTLSPLSRFPASKLSPLASTSTGTPIGGGLASGTRYGVALTGQQTGGPIARTWGSTTPTCGKCGKNVYFAEQVKAAGKTFHKGCLRCAECNTLLDSTRLTEKDGRLLCRRCYGKLHGPQGSGYALLGKAGG